MKQLDFEHGTVTGNILGAAVPMLVVFPFFQRYFSKGMVVGAVKG